MQLSRIEEMLLSGKDNEVQRGLGFAVIELVKELRVAKKAQAKESISTLAKRPPENGDVLAMYCKECFKEVNHIFRKTTGPDGEVILVEWRCTNCGNVLNV